MADDNTEGRMFGGGFFDTFRVLPYPTLYGPMKTPVTVDVLEVGFLFAIGILAISFFIVIPGVILKKRLIFFLKIVIGLFILMSIFLCNFGQEWEVAEANAVTQYKAGIRQHIHAEIGVKIGLRSVNITLRAHDENESTVNLEGQLETINYNERFSWDNPGWTQGRAGFGPFAARINQEFRDGQFRGLPYPILWIAEYFVPDGEGIRWGRYYRQAGYYTHIFMWLAFPLYILSIVLIMVARSYGIAFFLLTGFTMIGGNLCFGLIRNPTQLLIPFEPEKLIFHWGWCFWLCLVTGVLNIFLGVVALILDMACPDWFSDFLNIDMSKSYEEFYLSREELESLEIAVPKDRTGRYSKANGSTSKDNMNGEVRVLRKPMTGLSYWGTKRFAKSRATENYRIIENQPQDRQEYNPGYKSRPPLPHGFADSSAHRRPVVPDDSGRFEPRNSVVKPYKPDMSFKKMEEDYIDYEDMYDPEPDPMIPDYDNANLEESMKRLSHMPHDETDTDNETLGVDDFYMEPIPRPKIQGFDSDTKF